MSEARRIERVVVLGAGYAGVMAAVRVAKRGRGRVEVLLVNGSEVFVERIRQHQRATGQRLVVSEIARLLAGTGVRFVRGMVRRIEPEAQLVELDGEVARIPYDRLIVALGSRVEVDAVDGVRTHAYTLDADGAVALEARLPEVAARAGRLVVCGGGLTGIEAATEIAERFSSLRVTLVTAGELGAGLSVRGAAYLRRAFERLKIDVVERTPVCAVRAGEVELAGGALACDVCVWAGGFVASPLMREAGLAVDERGRAIVDAELRSISEPRIHVAGAAAAPPAEVGAPIQMSCKTAMPMGAHAADNVVAEVLGKPTRALNFGDSGLCISLGRRDALVQPHRRDGSVREKIYTGRIGVFLKERICRYTLWSLRVERRWFWAYRWLRMAPARALPASQAEPPVA